MTDSNRLYSPEKYKAIAIGISTQLGGAGRIKVMLGIDKFTVVQVNGGGLAFKFKGSRTYNYCEVLLIPNNTYTVKFGKVTNKGYTVIRTETDVYCDRLKPLFEKVTGLYLTLCS